MVSDKEELFGSGMCGKGHKEWVKVSDGGPYLKCKVMIIRRPASKGCELAPTVILQGHCDMVCEKKPGILYSVNS